MHTPRRDAITPSRIRTRSLAGALLLALTVTVLPPPGLSGIAVAAASSAGSGERPEQLGGSAAGREHEVGAAQTDANGGNSLKTRDLTADAEALPLVGDVEPFAPVEPDIEPNEIQIHPQVPAERDASGFDPERSEEVTEERTRYTKDFRNPDGTTTTRLYAQPVHYQDENGTWREIDTSLVPEDSTRSRLALAAGGGESGRVTVAADDTDLSISTEADAPDLAGLGVGEGGQRVEFGLEQAADVPGRVSGDAVTYEDIRPDADLELEAHPGMVKETITLNSPDAPREWTFPLRLDGLAPELDENGAVLFRNGDGEAQAVVPTGWMEDSSTDPVTGGPAMSGDVHYRLDQRDGAWFLTVVLDDAWLDAPEREYPVKVDPSTVDIDAYGDAFVQDDWPNSNFSGDDELKVGSYNGGSSRAISYLRFDNVSNQLENRYILNADLNLFNHWSSYCNPREVRVHQVTEAWTAGTVTWNNRPSSKSSAVAADSFAYGESCGGSSWHTIDLGTSGINLVQGWVEGTVSNYGLSLWADFNSSYTWKRFGSLQSANKPYLNITHSSWGARYTVGAKTEALTGHQGGEVTVTVKNLGDMTWEPQGWNEFRLGARARDHDTGAALDAVAFTRLNERLTPGDSATLNARIPSLPPGQYWIDFDMQRLKDQRWFSDEDVPKTIISITSQDVGPRINNIYPRPGAQVGSLIPSLFVDAESQDNWPAGATIEYSFEVCAGTPSAPTGCVNSGWVDTRNWTVPADTLTWGEQFVWRVQTREDASTTPVSPYYPFITAVEQPAITSHLGGASLSGAGREVDPLIGNYTTTDTDADVAAVGPSLAVNRTYNSRDPRTDTVFGAGWSTRFDMRVAADGDGTGNVVVTYPDGRQVRFGKNADGGYAPPFGSFATLTTTAEGGWRLTDKNQTGYIFDASGRITEITDFRGRTQTFGYAADGTLETVTSPGGRALHFAWANGHVATVITDPPESGADPLTWTYTYSGDRLTEVCGPEDVAGACTAYTYTDGSHYRTVVHDAGPVTYWRLGEAAGATDAPSDLLLDGDRHTATYQNVQLGSTGVLAGSPDTAATFDGSSSYVQLPDWLGRGTPYLTVEMWFRTTQPGVIATLQDAPVGETPSRYSPFLNVDGDGKLRGQFYTLEHAGHSPIISPHTVTDGQWHHVALTGSGNTQTLYLDGTAVGSLSGTIAMRDDQYPYLGAGWGNDGWMGVGAGTHHFAGDIDEFAIYGRPLGARTVAEHHTAGSAAQQLTDVTLPSGRTHVHVDYDTADDRVSAYTDANGGTYMLSGHVLTGTEGAPLSDDGPAVPEDPTATVTVTDPDGRDSSYTYDPLNGYRLSAQTDAAGHTATFEYDTGGFLAATTGPDGTVTRQGHDERGNKISQTTCRDAADETSCSTSYFAYFLNADDPLDPRNDQLIAERDARSAGATDDTYRTAYGYNTFGDRVSTTTPATPDFPSGRSVTHTFTDGTEAAVGGGTVPAGLLLTTTDSRGGLTSRAYYASGDLAAVTGPNGLVTEYTYDALGREISSTVISDAHPEGVTTTYAYDGASRLTTVTGPATSNAVTGESHQAATAYTYDADGLALTETVSDLLGTDASRTTMRAYDTQGRLASVTDAEEQSESYTYDVYGNQVTRTMAGGETYRYSYTARGNLAEVVLTGYTGDPNNSQPATDVVLDSYAYDPAGRLAEHTGATGRTTRYTYYDDGLPAQEIRVGFRETDGSTRDIVLVDNVYDAAGNLITETSGNGTVTTAYEVDAASRTTAGVLDPGGLARRIAYTYDAGGAVLTETRTGAGGTRTETVSYDRDITGAWTSRTIENGTEDLTATRVLDDRGLVVSETTPGGATTDYTYDNLGRLTGTQAPAVTVEERNTTAASERPAAALGYNTFGENTHAKDARGHVTTTSYDGVGRPVTTTLPSYTPPGSATALTPAVTSAYDSAGHLASETDPLGGVTSYTYDQFGNLASVTEPPAEEGGTAPVFTFTYTVLGEQLSATDPTGARAEATYDDLGRQITSTVIESHGAAGIFTTAMSYDDAGNLVSTTSPSGVTTSATYNTAGQPVTETNAASQTTSYGYGPTGLLTAVTEPLGTKVRTSYDPAGRPTTVTTEDSSGTTLTTASTGYDADSRPVSVTNELGHTTSRAYDALGRVTSLTEPVDDATSITTTFGYDAKGNRTRLTDGRGNTTWYTHTSHGLPESVIEPSTTAHPESADRTWTTVYDTAGNPVEERKPGGVTQTRTFDALGRLTQTTGTGAEANTDTDTFGYDLAGRLTSAGSNTYTYNDRGQLLTADGPSGTASFTYDEDGRLTQRTDAAGTASFTYDTAGRLSTAADPLTGASYQYAYDAVSRLSTITYGTAPASQRTFTYDALGRLASDTLSTPGSVTSASVSYTYDAASQLTGKTSTGTAGAGENAYTYDHAGRLTSWTAPGGTVTDYTWDAAGNRTAAGADTATYDERNRIITAAGTDYTWTPRGTLAQTTEPDSTTETFTYDALGRLVTDGTITYSYDPLGRVIQRGTETIRYADQTNNPVHVTGELIARDIYGEPLSTAPADGGTGATIAVTDIHGDVTAALDPAAGTVNGSRAYSPFGETTAQQGTTSPLGYQGEYTDPDTGRVNMHARWYDPTTGAFTSRDTWTLNPNPSIQANRYTYANGSPLIGTDPTGHLTDGSTLCRSVGGRALPPVRSGCLGGTAGQAVGGRTGQAVGTGVGVGASVGATVGSVVPGLGTAAGAGVGALVGGLIGLGYALSTSPGTASRSGSSNTNWLDGINDINRQMRQQAQRAAIRTAAEAYAAAYSGCQQVWQCVPTFSSCQQVWECVPEFSSISRYSPSNYVPGRGGNGGNGIKIKASPPPPPNWAQILAGVLQTPYRRPSVDAVVDPELEDVIDGSFVDAFLETGDDFLSLEMPDDFHPCRGGLLGWQCTGSGNLLDPDTGIPYCRPGGNPAIGSTCLLLPGSSPNGAPSGTIGRCRPGNSFEPGTHVLMADGTTKPIEHVSIGDTVIATDPESGEISVETVTAEILGNGLKRLVEITVDTDGLDGPQTETITATAGHPFWVPNLDAWVEASDLKPGHWLRTSAGTHVQITALTTRTDPAATVHNLTVADKHTYYVLAGTTPVLVHNTNSPIGCGVNGEPIYDIPAGSSGGAGAGKRIPPSLLKDYDVGKNAAPGATAPLCSYCRTNPATAIDHVEPRIGGGDLTDANTTPACTFCNSSKRDRLAPLNPPPNYTGSWPPPWWPSRMTPP